MADDDKTCPGANRDVLQLGPDLGNGTHPFVRHRPGCDIEAGVLKAHQPGNDEATPACDGMVRLHHSGHGQVYNVETLYERNPRGVAPEAHDGPAMVATEAFRDGWDRIFGVNKTVGQA
jgi:hypothetical protein